MLKFALLFVFCFILSDAVYAQDAETRTDAVIAGLAKTKYKKKEKKNLTVETYVQITNEAVVKPNVSEYAGVYEAGDDYRLELRVTPNGTVEGSGYDMRNNWKRQNFTLKDARIEGALLSATKVFESGETENFEAVFTNRTVVRGKNPNEIEERETKYGLGFIQNYGDWTSRVFLELK